MRLDLFKNKLVYIFLAFVFTIGFGGFVALKRKNPSPVPVLWKTDVGPFLDTKTPFVQTPGGGLLASTYSKLLELDPMGVLQTNITKSAHRFKFPRPIAVETNGTVYHSLITHGILTKIRAQKPDGSELWRTDDYDLKRSAPPLVAHNGLIYLNASSNLVALSRSGHVEWSYTVDAPIYQPPSIGPDGTVHLISGDHLYCLNQEGSLQWDLPGDGWYSRPAVSSDGMIYVRGGSTNLTLTAIQPDGKEAWTYSNARYGHAVCGPILSPNGAIHVIGDKKLITLNPDGSLKWARHLGKYLSMQDPVVASDGTLFVASADPKVTAVGPDGEVKWVFQVPKKGNFYIPKSWNGVRKIIKDRFGFSKPILVSRPLLAPDGTLYVGFGQQYGSIYALSTGKEPFGIRMP